jgi:hypothetical protein
VEVVAELLLLQVLLRQVLKVALREGQLRRHRQLGLVARDRHGVAQRAGLAVNLRVVFWGWCCWCWCCVLKKKGKGRGRVGLVWLVVCCGV